MFFLYARWMTGHELHNGLFFNVVNITNTPLLKYAYYGNQFLYAEDSGVRFNFGVRASF